MSSQAKVLMADKHVLFKLPISQRAVQTRLLIKVKMDGMWLELPAGYSCSYTQD